MKQYSEPTIYPKRPTPGDMNKIWRIRWRFFHAGKWHQVSRKYELNQIHDFDERLLEAKAIAKAQLIKLQKGWNPITNTYPSKTLEELRLEELQNMTFSQAMDWAYSIKKKEWSKKSCSDYRSKIKYLKLAAPDKPIKDFRKFDYKLTLEAVTEDRKLSPSSYNTYRDYLSTLVGVLAEWDILESNPIGYIKCKDLPKKKAHRPPTQDQRLAIVGRIKDENRHYYRFLSVLYGCTIRPVEISRLRISHLHKMEQVFRLTADITKNKADDDVAIPDWVMDLLMELKLEKYPRDYYIFGGHPHTFLPGPNQLSHNTCRYWWNKIVRKGLNMNVNQYSIKKMAADDLVKLQQREGATNLLGLAQMHMRHHDASQSKVYTDEHENIKKEIIKRKMPVL